MQRKHLHIALVGNPNIGKTSLFNVLTGLNQKVGNFPGVTVDKKSGECKIAPGLVANVVDLPGTYSLYPKRGDEWVTYKVLMYQDTDSKPDIIVLLADASNMKRNSLFVSQIIDLKIPVVVALTMLDLAKKKGIEIDIDGLERELGVPVVAVNPRKDRGIPQLKKAIEQTANNLYKAPAYDFIANKELAPAAVEDVKKQLPPVSDYAAIHYLINHEGFPLNNKLQDTIENIESIHKFNPTKTQRMKLCNAMHA